MGETAGARMTDFFVSMPQQTQACHEPLWDGFIHAATILASRNGAGTHSRLCVDSDHMAQEYALFPLLNPSQPARSPNMSQPLS